MGSAVLDVIRDEKIQQNAHDVGSIIKDGERRVYLSSNVCLNKTNRIERLEEEIQSHR